VSDVVLLVDNSDLSRIIYHALDAEFHIKAVVREARIQRLTLFFKRVERLGFRTAVGQAEFALFVMPWLKLESRRRRREILIEYGMDDSPLPVQRVVDVPSVNSNESVILLQNLHPKVILVNGTRILEERLLDATKAVLLNTHVGITPRYRGVHGGYWALASGDPDHCGVTVHKIDKGIDTGDIVAQAVIRPKRSDNFSTYPLLQIANAIPLLKHAIHDALTGRLETVQAQDEGSKLWSHPTALQYLKMRSSLGVR
jgi:folate-dependent phosphoribosylglycinamide formyltransferase PurN